MRKFIVAIALTLIVALQAYAGTIVRLGPEYFPESDRSRAIANGYIYVGEPSLDPTVPANQKTLSVQQENGTVVPVSQPLRTNAGGVPVYSGSPVTMIVTGAYSLLVQDSTATQVYYVPSNVTGTSTIEYSLSADYDCDYSEAVSDIGAVNDATIKVDCACTLDSGETITSTDNIAVQIIKGGSFDGVAGGATETLNINGPLHVVGEGQIFGANIDANIGYNETALPEWWGSAGDGSTTDTTPVQEAFNCGAQRVLLQRNYKVGTVTIPTAVAHVYGGGTLTQAAKDSNVLSVTSSTGLLIEDLSFVGVTGVSASNNHGVFVTGSSNVTVRGCRFDDFVFQAVRVEDSTYVIIRDNRMYGNYSGCLFRGVTDSDIIGNIIIGDGDDTTFQVPVALDSTDGHALGVCERVRVISNEIKDYGAAQGVLLHAGLNCVVSDNIIDDVTIGISANPFNATDTLTDLVIDGNNINCNTTSSTDSSYGIFAGGGSGFEAKSVIISNNTIQGANVGTDNNNEGGIGVGHIFGVTIAGNNVYDCESNGIVINNPVSDLSATGNIVKNIDAGPGDHNALLINGDVDTANIRDNILETDDGAGFSVRVNSGFTISNVRIDKNIVNATEITNDTNVVLNGVAIYTAADTTPTVRYARFMRIANAGAVTITDFDDGIDGQTITLLFGDSNTTVDRTNSLLDGSVNVTPDANDTLQLTYYNGKWYQSSKRPDNG